MANPFETADAWEVSTGMHIPNGNHVVRITHAEDTTAKSSKNPQVYLELEDDQGRDKKEWVPYHSGFLGKIIALYQSAGLEIPQEGEFNPSDNCRLTTKKISSLVGKRIGIVMRDGSPRQTDGKIYPEIQGFTTPERIGGGKDMGGSTSEIPIDTGGLNAATDDDIPF